MTFPGSRGGGVTDLPFTVTNHPVRRFTDLTAALRELQPFVVNGRHLWSGRPFANFNNMRSRELLANWLLCVAVNSGLGSERLMVASQPIGVEGDGVILDTVTGEPVLTEHVLVPSKHGGPCVDVGALILAAVEHKHARGAAYGSRRTLVVFREATGEPWLPKHVAERLPADLAFDAVWVVGLERVEDGQYTYWVTRLDLRRGVPPVWYVTIAADFNSWRVHE
jgi:hypothetical protein